MGLGSVAPTRFYPGDAYVDVIGMDAYDQYWGRFAHDPSARWDWYLNQPYGLRWHVAFARAHRKALAYPEWGVMWRSDGHGGGDSPYFVHRMAEWFRTNAVEYAVLFNHDSADVRTSLTSGRFPKAAAAFRRVFATAAARPRRQSRPATKRS